MPRSPMKKMVWWVASVCSDKRSPRRCRARSAPRDLPVGVRLRGVHAVRELDGVLDEEDRDVVADQVEDALTGVELVAKPPVSRTVSDDPRGKPTTVENRVNTGVSTSACEEPRLGTGGRAVALEDPVRARAPGVHHALRDALVVKP